MNTYDYVCFCKMLQNAESDLTARVIALERRYDIFGKRFDELDLLELMELKIQLKYLNELVPKLLKLCDYLLSSSDE